MLNLFIKIKEENWGEFDDVVLEFIQRFIKDEIKK